MKGILCAANFSHLMPPAMDLDRKLERNPKAEKVISAGVANRHPCAKPMWELWKLIT